MKLEKIKRDFVRHMEEIRAGDPYPSNFFGCLISIIIEPEPISQQRLMELTGYSQATISLTLQRIQLLLPIRKIRRLGDRKHYYTYDGSPERFILDLWQKRLEAQAIDVQMIEAMLDKVRAKAKGKPVIKRFLNYLTNIQLFLSLVHELRTTGVGQFKIILVSGSFNDLKSQDATDIEEKRATEFLEIIRNKTLDIEHSQPIEDDLMEEYLQLTNEYFTGIKMNLNPLYSQKVANQMMVIHNVFLEGVITQHQLEKVTQLPRSTISEVLSQSVKSGIIKFTKEEGSRVKMYQPVNSFIELMLGYYDQLVRYISIIMPRLMEFISSTKSVRPVSDGTRKFLDVLDSFKNAYSFTQEYSKRMKLEMILRLHEEYDEGFVFI